MLELHEVNDSNKSNAQKDTADKSILLATRLRTYIYGTQPQAAVIDQF